MNCHIFEQLLIQAIHLVFSQPLTYTYLLFSSIIRNTQKWSLDKLV